VTRHLASALLLLLVVGWVAASAAELALDAGDLQTFHLEAALPAPQEAEGEVQAETALEESMDFTVAESVDPPSVTSGSGDVKVSDPPASQQGASEGTSAVSPPD
jgi:hypothetical protein